jgi:hypothetical protein
MATVGNLAYIAFRPEALDVHDLYLFLLAMALVLSIYFTVRKISVPAKNYDVEVSETQEMHNKKSRILASNDFFPVKLHEEHLC